MAVWTLMPANKKSIEEVVYWEKDGKTIFFRQGWRSGSVTITTADDSPPNIDLDGNEELSVFDLYDDHVLDVELDSFWDGVWGEWDWNDEDLSDDEKEEIEDAWNENSYEGVEDLGWIQSETDTFFYGELTLEPVTEQ